MQKGAQYQAVWELISEIFKDKIPADSIINGLENYPQPPQTGI